VEQSRYFGKILKNQNYFKVKMESKLKSGNAFYHSVQNLLSYSLLLKNMKLKIYKIIIACFFFMCVKLGISRYGKKYAENFRD
jgi:hypothetical protein